MSVKIEINQGEVRVNMDAPQTGKVSFADLGIKNDDLKLEGGLLRLVFDFKGMGEHKYFQMPTICVEYQSEMGETHWQCDFNGKTIVDKMDHHGHSTIVLMNRAKIVELEQRHENELVLHGEFPEAVQVDVTKSYVNLFN